MKILKPFLISLLFLGLAACGEGFIPVSSTSGTPESVQSVKVFGTCDRKAVNLFNLCSELVGADYNDADYLGVLLTNCEATGGVFSQANCDRTESIGTCFIGKNQSNEVHSTYYPPLYSSANAQADCDSKGGEFLGN